MTKFKADYQPNTAEKRHLKAEVSGVKEIDSPNGGFAGYVSTFANVDRGGERVNKGSTLEHLDAFKRDGWLAVGHKWGELGCGFVKAAYEDDIGVWVEFEFHSDADSQAIRTKIKERIAAGKTVATSIGYFLRDWKVVEGVLELLKIELKEVSIVNVPMNPLAVVSSAKSMDGSRIDAEGAFVRDIVETYMERVLAKGEFRGKDGRELSSANIATIEAVIGAIDDLDKQKQSLKDLVDRNKKGLESDPTPAPSEADEAWRVQRAKDLIRIESYKQTGVVLP